MDTVKELREQIHPGRNGQLLYVMSLIQSLSFHPRRKLKSKVVTFGVYHDGVFTMEALSFMSRLTKIKYQATQGCRNYLVMRGNWINHWFKLFLSGLVNVLASGMVQSYTDLAAQQTITQAENRNR